MMTNEGARMRLSLAACAVTLALIGVVAPAVLAVPPTAHELLTRAQAHAAVTGSVRFVGAVRITTPDDTDDKSSVSSLHTDRGRILGEVQDQTHVRARIEGANGWQETIVAGRYLYTRFADGAAGLRSEQFAKIPLAEAAEGEVDPTSQSLDFPSLLRLAQRAVVTNRHNGKHTVRFNLVPRQFYDRETAATLSDLRVTAVIRSNGELVSITQALRGDDLDGVISLHFSDWGSRIRVAAPAADQIDPTPHLNEAAVAGYRDTGLYMPQTIPTGWELTYADVIPADETAEGCAQVELDYEPSDPDDDTYLYLYFVPLSCAEVPDAVQRFTAGRYPGFIVTEDGSSLAAVLVDNRTVMQADTNLSPDALRDIIDTLVPLDLGAKPLEAPTASIA